MGNDESKLVDESTPPQSLDRRDLNSLAKYITSGHTRRVVVMSGAGISTSAGIPDFRSPDTGLYANLAKLNLPYAEAVFDISFFRNNPLPFYTLAQELYPGKFRPTITHSFITLLHEKGMLLKHFTQNIDCLDREAGVPSQKIIEAHGSFARQSCIECKTTYPSNLMLEHVQDMKVPHCLREGCGDLVKPEIVFFGEALPPEFIANRGLAQDADLVIVLGTSLTVQPFASLPGMASEGIPRVLINLEQVGGIGGRSDDVLMLGDCDAGVCKLAEACGWLDELVELWESVGGKVDAKHPANREPKESTEPAKDKDDIVADEVEKLTSEVDKSLKISDAHEKESRGFVKNMAQAMEPKSNGKPESSQETDALPRETEVTKEGSVDQISPPIQKKPSL